MRAWVSVNRWMVAVAVCLLPGGAAFYELMEPASWAFAIGSLVAVVVAASMDHRRNVRDIRAGRLDWFTLERAEGRRS